MSETYDAIIVGAGISGAATACRMARAGHEVLLIDRYGPAAMASGWTLAGVRQSGRHVAELPLAKAAVALWPTLDEDLGAPTHYRRGGNLRIARNDAEYAQIRAMVDDQAAAGLELDFLPDTAAVRAIAPAIGPCVVGASLCPTDGHADPVATVAAFVAAARRAGATVRSGEGVSGISIRSGRVTGVVTALGRYAAPRVILAAGFQSCDLLSPLGIEIPVRVRMVTVLRSTPVAPLLEQVLGVATSDWACRQEADGRLRVTGGGNPWHGAMEERTGGPWPRPAVAPPMGTVAPVVTELERLLPGATAAPLDEIWAGLIDLTPDALPVLDRAPGCDGLVLGMGFSGHGFCLGPLTGRILAALALGEPPGFDLSAFAADRFDPDATPPATRLTLNG